MPSEHLLDRSLALVSDPHKYEKGDRYRALAKVVDNLWQ